MARKRVPGEEPLAPNTVLEPPVSGGLPAFQSGELEEGIRPTPWGSWVERLKEVSMDSEMGFMPGFEGALVRGHTQSQIEEQFRRENRAKITADEANRRYPGLPKPFTEDLYPEVADLIASDNRRREDLRSWISRGQDPGWFTASIVGGFADPVNLALMVATGGISRAAGLANTVRNSFLLNLGGNVATSAMTLPQRMKERQDVGIAQEAVSVVGGAVGGTALEFAIQGAAKGLSRLLGRSEAVAARAGAGAQERNLRAAVAQHEAGARVDVTPASREMELRMAGATEPGAGGAPYVFRPGEPNTKVFYAARQADGTPVRFADVGEVGIHAVDNSRVANNLAADPESIATGRLQEIRLPEDAKLLDLEAPVASAKEFIQALERKMGVKIELPEGATVGDALQEIRHEIVYGDMPRPATRVAADVARELGYDGYVYVDKSTGSPHNGLVLFDEGRAVPGQEFTANKEITPRMNAEEQKQLSEFDQQPDRAVTYEAETEARTQAYIAQEPAHVEADYMDPILQQQELEAKAFLKDAAVDDPAIQDEIQGLTRQNARDQQTLQAMRDYTTCLTGGMV